MGTDIDAALDEVFYGRHSRFDVGLPASLGARTKYDIMWSHQRVLKRQEADRLEVERQERITAKARAVVENVLRYKERALAAVRHASRQAKASGEVSLWQEEGWEKWWELLRLAARNRGIQEADYDECDSGRDHFRYLLLWDLTAQVAAQHGYSANMAKAVAAAIFINGIPPERNLQHQAFLRRGTLW